MSKLNKIFVSYIRVANYVEKAVRLISICLLSLIVLIVMGGVISRQVGRGVPVWYGEVQRYLAMWAILLMVGPFIYTDSNFNLRLKFLIRSDKFINFLSLARLLPPTVISIVFIVWGWDYAMTSGTIATAASMDFQMFWVYLVLPVSGILMLFYVGASVIKIIYKQFNIREEIMLETPEADIHD